MAIEYVVAYHCYTYRDTQISKGNKSINLLVREINESDEDGVLQKVQEAQDKLAPELLTIPSIVDFYAENMAKIKSVLEV